MRYLLDEALEQGAWGYSTGLEYAAERGADEDELVSMCEVCGRRHGIYATHTRLPRRGRRRAPSRRRCARRERSGVRLQVSHLVPRNGLESARRCIELVDDAAAGGMDIAFDMHTRLYGTTFLLTRAAALGARRSVAAARAARASPAQRRAMRELREHPQRRRRLGPHRAARQRRPGPTTRGATSPRSPPSAARTRSTPSTTCCSARRTTRAA